MRRPQRPEDDEWLQALFGSAQGEVFSGLDPALAGMLLRQQFSAQSATYRAAFPDGCFDIVEVDGEPVGRLVTDASDGAIRLVDVAVLPKWQGRGLGTRLLLSLQDEARTAGVPLRLSVVRSNLGARRLYDRLGFQPIETTEAHVSLQWASCRRSDR